MASGLSVQVEELDLVGGLGRDVVNVFGFAVSFDPSLVGTFSTPMTHLLTSVAFDVSVLRSRPCRFPGVELHHDLLQNL